jgi:hypothetical protein
MVVVVEVQDCPGDGGDWRAVGETRGRSRRINYRMLPRSAHWTPLHIASTSSVELGLGSPAKMALERLVPR